MEKYVGDYLSIIALRLNTGTINIGYNIDIKILNEFLSTEV